MLLNPEVMTVPLSEHPDMLEQTYPEVFSVCAVTHTMSGKKKRESLDEKVDMADSGCLTSLISRVPSRVNLCFSAWLF